MGPGADSVECSCFPVWECIVVKSQRWKGIVRPQGKKSSPVGMGCLEGGWDMGGKEFVQFNQQ